MAPSGTNRFGTFLIGLVLLLLGAAGVVAHLAATGMVRLGFVQPESTQSLAELIPPITWPVALLLGIGGLVVALIGLSWLLRQFPKVQRVKPFRLHDDPDQGVTRVDTSVLNDALADEIDGLPGVVRSTVKLTGTHDSPAMLVKLVVNERADVQRILSELQHRIVGDLARAVEGHVSMLRVQIEATGSTGSEKRVEYATGEEFTIDPTDVTVHQPREIVAHR